MRIGSLCSGYGGLELGVQAVYGGTTAWVSDIDKGACKILAHRFPDVPNIGDMTAVDWAAVEPVDLICGGTPCQDLSHAGKRAGMTKGTRSNLWVAMREAIAVIRPRYVVWENVRGAYSACADSDMGRCPRCVDPSHPGGHAPLLRALGRVLGDLSDLGYDASWHGLRAADVGGCHSRFRVFVIATDAQRVGQHGGPPQSVRRSIERTAAAWGGETTLLPTPAVNDMGAGKTVEEWDAWTQRMKVAHGNGNGHGPSLSIEALRLLPTLSAGAPDAKVSDRARELYSSTDRIADVVEKRSWGEYADAIARWERLTRSAPAPTEIGPKGADRLSPTFSEWMMGLPAGWVTDVPGITRNEALRALGNGVVPQQAAEALRIMASWDVAA